LIALVCDTGPARATADNPGIVAARGTLARLGVRDPHPDLSLRPAAQPYYRVRIVHGHILAQASSPVGLVHGVVQVLERLGRLHVSWEGRRSESIKAIAAYDSGVVTSPFQTRAYLNPCTFGYTTPWWTWARWSREIDWMAAQGVDMPLAMEGQEYVWRTLWLANGMHAASVANSQSAPPFLPWQRMGNLAGYDAPLSPRWIARKHTLQRRILARMRALGMNPVLPAFAGYVPEAFARAHPDARIYRMRAWEGFAPTYWLDPEDPLFDRIARQYLVLFNRTYGKGQYYLLDAFNEMVPPIAEDGSDAANARYGDSIANTDAARVATLPAAVRDARLAAYGERLYRALTTAVPDAHWVMQGWMFGADNAFWTPQAIAAFLRKVPDDRVMVLDIGNDRYPGIWRDTHGFDGKHWVYGYVHNYGGSNPVYGDPEFYRQDLTALLRDHDHGRLTGFGMFPEGLHSSSLVYAYAYALAWGEPDRPLVGWLRDYTRARYGYTSDAVVGAWQRAIDGAYRTRYWTPRWWHERAGAYLLFKRPTAQGADYPAPPGDRAALRDAVEQLLAQARAHPAPLLLYDLVDWARHYASLVIDDHLKAAIANYRAGAIAKADGDVATAAALVRLTDSIAAGQGDTLDEWVGQARAMGDSAAERARFARQARALVTVWGGTGHLSDYASRAWAGLYAGYYWPRWQIFLERARSASVADKPFDEAAATEAIHRFETGWVRTGGRPTAADHTATTDQIDRILSLARDLPAPSGSN
jgi:alpha-N-acetylglucosaminidase